MRPGSQDPTRLSNPRAGGPRAISGLTRRPAQARAGPLDLSKPLDDLVALLKLQADLSGAPVDGGFPGKAWGWTPEEGNVLLFNTCGIGASRLAWSPEDQAFRLMHREALFDCDPKSGEVLDVWTNPLTGARLDVLHIPKDPVNRMYRLKGGPLAPPYPYMANAARLVRQLDVLRGPEKSPMSRKEYSLHAQQDLYQSGELGAISGSLAGINDPKLTSARCHTSWKHVSPWLPFTFSKKERDALRVANATAAYLVATATDAAQPPLNGRRKPASFGP